MAVTHDRRDPAPENRTLAISVALLVVLTLAVFLPSLGYEFVNYDDPIMIANNPHVANGVSIDGLRWAFTTFYGANWFPLTWISWMLGASLFGLDARAFHATGVLLHACTAALLFLTLVRATGKVAPSAFVAAVFAVHPLHVESVVWISALKDTLSGLFFALALLVHCGGRGATPTPQRRAALFGCVLASLMAKPTAVVLPFALVLLDAWPLGRLGGSGSKTTRALEPRALLRSFAEKVELFVLVAVASGIFFAAQQHAGVVVPLERLGLGSRIANALVAYAAYLGKAFWPSSLAVLYPHPGDSLPLWQPALAGVLLLAVSVAALSAWRRAPAVLVGWLWFLGMLVPTIGIVQVGSQAMADRYMYLPLVGLAVALAFGLPALSPRATHATGGRLAIAAAAVAVVGLATTAAVQTAVWRNSITLFEHTLDVTKDNPIAHAHLGAALLARGRVEETVTHYTKSIRLSPNDADVANNFAWLLATYDDVEIRNPYLAVRLAERAVARTQRSDPGMLDTLAAAYATAGRFDEAVTTAEDGAALARARGRDPLARGIESRLVGYRDERPYVHTTLDPAP